MRQWSNGVGAAAVAALLAVAGLSAQQDAAITAKARAIHERVMTLDTHDDINPANFTKACNYTEDLGNQVNLPKMIKGGLDAVFFVVYVGQGDLTPEGYANAYKQAIEKFDAFTGSPRRSRLTRSVSR
jgi:membrane dipeptidase